MLFFSLAGCPAAAVENIHRAMKQGADNQALGMLICDWSGKGHVTDTLFSLPSLIAMSGMAWNKNIDQVTSIACPQSINLSSLFFCSCELMLMKKLLHGTLLAFHITSSKGAQHVTCTKFPYGETSLNSSKVQLICLNWPFLILMGIFYSFYLIL